MNTHTASSSSSAAGAGKGARAIAAPETAPKAEHALVSRTGINKAKGKPENPVAGRLIATWPCVDCSTETCDARARWNIMFQTREVIKEGGSGKWGDDADPEEITKYWCTLCMAKTWGVRPEEAQARILQERLGFAKKRAKNEVFKAADSKAAEAFPGITKGERRLVAIQLMIEAVAPLTKFIELKCFLRFVRGACAWTSTTPSSSS